jgi:AmiR/NasT family two-component response regulator
VSTDISRPGPRGLDGDGRVDGVPQGPDVARLRYDLAAADQAATNLRAALATNRRIGMAIGILMALRKVTEEEAFELLRQASSRRNVKLRLVAEEVVRTGELA